MRKCPWNTFNGPPSTKNSPRVQPAHSSVPLHGWTTPTPVLFSITPVVEARFSTKIPPLLRVQLADLMKGNLTHLLGRSSPLSIPRRPRGVVCPICLPGPSYSCVPLAFFFEPWPRWTVNKCLARWPPGRHTSLFFHRCVISTGLLNRVRGPRLF